MDKTDVFAKTSGNCGYCGREMWIGECWDVDHIIPKSRGGSDDPDNLIAACRSCNRRKKDRTPNEFRNIIRSKITRALSKVGQTLSDDRWFAGADKEPVLDRMLEAYCLLTASKIAFWMDDKLSVTWDDPAFDEAE